ncbi:MAG: hypothetical protein Wins2KO_08920 [Winogradskyella sp.]
MKKVFVIFGFLAAILATVLAVTPLSNIAIIPIIVAFVSGLMVLYISKKEESKPKTIQYIFLLVIISLSLTIYKGLSSSTEIGDTEQLEQRDEENLEDSIDILDDIDIEE